MLVVLPETVGSLKSNKCSFLNHLFTPTHTKKRNAYKKNTRNLIKVDEWLCMEMGLFVKGFISSI